VVIISYQDDTREEQDLIASRCVLVEFAQNNESSACACGKCDVDNEIPDFLCSRHHHYLK
jgi:hypothetical protein